MKREGIEEEAEEEVEEVAVEDLIMWTHGLDYDEYVSVLFASTG